MKKILFVVMFLLLQMAAPFSVPVIAQGIENGLVAHWTFDNDTDDKIHDATSNDLHGTAYNVSYSEGPVSTALVFNGVNSRVIFPDLESEPPDTIGKLDVGSISLWFTFKNRGGDILPMLYFGESDRSNPHNSLIIEIGHNDNPNDRRLYFTIIVAPYDVTRFCFDSGMNLEEDVWYHFVAVVSPEGNTGYLNGQELITRRYNLNSNATYTDFFSSVTSRKRLALGYGRYGRDPAFYPFEGALDDIRIYNRPLDKNEVKELYALGSTTGVEYPLPEGAEIKLQQNSPNPFSGVTTIRYASEIAGDTVLEVFDITGKRVITKEFGFKPDGKHEIGFDGYTLMSGTYLYRVLVGTVEARGKMIVGASD
jgi:hypothetical protein